MNRAQSWPAKVVAFTLIALTALLGCTDDPVKPKPMTDYPVYFYDTLSPTDCFVYHPPTTQVENFTLPHPVDSGGIRCSANGKSLYICTSVGVDILDTETRTVETELPYRARLGIAPSPDGNLIALQGPGLRVLNTADYSVAFEDTSLDVCGCDFSTDSRRLYCAGGGRDSTVVIVEIDNNFTVQRDTIPLEGTVVDVLPSPDENMWYLFRHSSMRRSFFEAYNTEMDSVIFMEWLFEGRVPLAASPFGRYAFYAEEGKYGVLGSSHVCVFDIQAGRTTRLINTAGVKDGFEPADMPIGEIVISPDGSWLVAGAAYGRNALVRINLQSMQVDRFVPLPDFRRYFSYTCQLAP